MTDKLWSLCLLTVNPRISPLGAYLFLMLFGWGLIRGGLIRGGLIRGGSLFEGGLFEGGLFEGGLFEGGAYKII